MTAMSVGFVVALTWEHQLLQKHLPSATTVLLSGMGAANASAAASKLVAQGARGLISCGCCAGLHHALHSGDLILASHVVDAAGTCLPCDRAWQELLSRRLQSAFAIGNTTVARPAQATGNHRRQPSWFSGNLISINKPVCETKAKQQLASAHAAVAADMESFAIASIARAAAIPFLAVRVVLDDCQQNLPDGLTAACDDYGVPRTLAMLNACRREPGMIKELWPLARSRKLAARSLQLMASLWPDDTVLH